MNKIIFIIGSLDISGGTYVIFQHALYLQEQGFDITIAYCIDYDKYSAFKANQDFWHPALTTLFITSIEEASTKKYDLAIYTWWRTIYYLPQITAKISTYFVQSIESKFYNSKEKTIIQLVNDTYTFQLPVITEATWIQNYLKEHYQVEAMLAKNGIRKDLYTQDGTTIAPKTNKLRVLVEGPLKVPFKNTERTIQLCAKVPDIELWLLTSSDIKRHSKVDKLFSRIPITEVGAIYRSCDVLVKLSYVEGMFAPPLELFHCGGTCIVYAVNGHDEYIQNEYNGIVIKKNDEKGVLTALKQLSQDRDYLNKLKKGAAATAKKWINWSEASRIYLQCLNSLYQPHNMPCEETKNNQIKLIQQAFKTYEILEQKKFSVRLRQLKNKWLRVSV